MALFKKKLYSCTDKTFDGEKGQVDLLFPASTFGQKCALDHTSIDPLNRRRMHSSFLVKYLYSARVGLLSLPKVSFHLHIDFILCTET